MANFEQIPVGVCKVLSGVRVGLVLDTSGDFQGSSGVWVGSGPDTRGDFHGLDRF